MISHYKISLDNFRRKTKYIFKKLSFIRKIREDRERLIYHPILEQDTEVCLQFIKIIR